MASSNQGGSILSFLIIGGVLTALLIGGAYFVQQRSVQTATDKAPITTQPAVQPNETADKKDTATTEDKKAAVEPKKEDKKTDVAPQQPTPPGAQLPKTGPAETISSLLGVGLLSGMIVAYARSRRPAATL